MSVSELLQHVQFVVNAEGQRSGVLLSIQAWQELLNKLDSVETDQAENHSDAFDPEQDPAWQIVGMFSSGLGDLAEKHDEYLAEIYAEV